MYVDGYDVVVVVAVVVCGCGCDAMLLMRLTTKRRMKLIQPQPLGQARCTELQPDSARGAQPQG